jgi:hypothetical protein
MCSPPQVMLAIQSKKKKELCLKERLFEEANQPDCCFDYESKMK